MKQRAGFTLIEVLIAVMVLGVGVIAAASMQTTGLRASGTARIMQDVTNSARTEIELQRKLARGGTAPAPTNPGCSSASVSGQTCSITVVPCRLVNGVLTCSASSSGLVVADQVSVQVVGPQAITVELRTVVAR